MKHNIPLFKVYMAESAIEKVTQVLRSGFIGQGPVVDEFEKQLKESFNHDHIVTVNSATSAEHLALHLLKESTAHFPGIFPGDEILTTPMTCTATNWPILANGFNIKWVDIDPETLNMDLDDLARKITAKTKAIMIVHWGGYPVDLDKLRDIQNRCLSLYGFKPAIIEDCAHAMGSRYRKRLIGTHGNLCTLSLQAIKHVTAGDGGLLFCPREFYQRAKLLRWYGIDREGDRKDFRCEADIPEWGFKFHMNDINAAIGSENFRHMKEITDAHRENAKYYDEHLKGVEGIKLLKREKGFDSSFWIYSILVDRRDDFARHMKECGIATSQVHERNDIHTCVSKYRSILPNLDKTIGKISAIPVGWWVTPEEREYIVECIKKGW